MFPPTLRACSLLYTCVKLICVQLIGGIGVIRVAPEANRPLTDDPSDEPVSGPLFQMEEVKDGCSISLSLSLSPSPLLSSPLLPSPRPSLLSSPLASRLS